MLLSLLAWFRTEIAFEFGDLLSVFYGFGNESKTQSSLTRFMMLVWLSNYFVFLVLCQRFLTLSQYSEPLQTRKL